MLSWTCKSPLKPPALSLRAGRHSWRGLDAHSVLACGARAVALSTPRRWAIWRQITSSNMWVVWSNRLDRGCTVGGSSPRRYFVAAGAVSTGSAAAALGDFWAGGLADCSASLTVPAVVPDPDTATRVSPAPTDGVVASPIT